MGILPADGRPRGRGRPPVGRAGLAPPGKVADEIEQYERAARNSWAGSIRAIAFRKRRW